ncbi:MAG TPA: hypothetical protein PKL04_00910 [Methanofastidiosum sp.]|nr:hypothetical protein [Methanofastidiosum sp.]
MKKQQPRLQQSYGEPKRFVTVKLPIKIIEALDKVAAYDNVTRSYLISNILDNYVKLDDIQNCLKRIEKPYRY